MLKFTGRVVVETRKRCGGWRLGVVARRRGDDEWSSWGAGIRAELSFAQPNVRTGKPQVGTTKSR
jgi:hypothetical protein